MTYDPPSISDELRTELRDITAKATQEFGMDELPPLPGDWFSRVDSNAQP